MKTILGLVASACLCATSALAQNYSLDWFTVDGGGGTSTGGMYSVSGTIGQPDAGAMSGGNYSLAGGFWGIISAVPLPNGPMLSVQRISNTVRVSWPTNAAGFVLEQSPAVPGAWSQVPFPYATNATDISITVLAPVGNRFYRLRQP